MDLRSIPLPDLDVFRFRWLRGGVDCFLEERRLIDVVGLPNVPVLLQGCFPTTLDQMRSLLYFPLEDEPSLFRMFADADPSPDGVLKFVARYGALGRSAARAISPRETSGGPFADCPVYLPIDVERNLDEFESQADDHANRGEPLHLWQERIAWTAHLARLFDLAQPGDRVGLAEFVRWSGTTVAVRCPVPPAPRAWLPELPEWRWSGWRRYETARGVGRGHQFQQGDVVEPATFFLVTQVNEAMASAPTQMHLSLRIPEYTPELTLRPPDLWGAILVQFAQAIDGSVRHRRCLGCRRWFRLGPDDGARRADALTCSNACRVRAHRLKHVAIQMRSKRVAYKTIAERLNVDVNTIRRWCSTRKKEQ